LGISFLDIALDAGAKWPKLLYSEPVTAHPYLVPTLGNRLDQISREVMLSQQIWL